MDAKQTARALVGDAVGALVENEGGGKGSIPGPVIGWLIKKGEIDAPKGGKKRVPQWKRKLREKQARRREGAKSVKRARARVGASDDPELRRSLAKMHREP